MTLTPDLIASHIRNLIDEGGGVATASNLARLYRVRRRVVHDWVRHDDFPKPLAVVAWRSPIWLIAEVDDWKKRHYPRTGLPPRRGEVSP